MEIVKSQSQISCPEDCHFCDGIGLKSPVHTEDPSSQSCFVWPHVNSSTVIEEKFIPARWLKENALRRLRRALSGTKSLTILVGDLNWREEDLLRASEEYETSFWLVPSRKFDALAALKKIPTILHDKIYFYCPLYNSAQDSFLTSQELDGLFQKIRIQVPNFKIRAPKHANIFNPSLNLENIRTESKVVLSNTEPEKEIDLSIIIPTFNNSDYISRVVRALARQKTSRTYEVIVVDDGSEDNTLERLSNLFSSKETPENFKLLHFPRTSKREMGDFNFRAGEARNRGVRSSAGKILAFLDSDIIVPTTYIEDLFEAHTSYDFVQIERLYLTESCSKDLFSYVPINMNTDIFHPDNGYWKKFFESSTPWQDMPHPWKFACTFGLSLSRNHFEDVGGFRTAFNSYGFEDTDLAYRCHKKGLRFYRAPIKGYHLWHTSQRSEYKNSQQRRHELLKYSANIFYRHNLDSEIYRALGYMLVESRPTFPLWFR